MSAESLVLHSGLWKDLKKHIKFISHFMETLFREQAQVPDDSGVLRGIHFC